MHSSQLSPVRKIGDAHIFDLALSYRGLRINRMCHALNQEAGRVSFRADEAAFLARFHLTEEELALIRARDFNGLLAAGANIYYLIKLGTATGNGLYKMGACMRGESYEAFLATRNNSGAV
jgi:protocatechuate 4,5-dioxygenase, alpha chain